MEYFGYATECWFNNNEIDVQIAISIQDGPGNEVNNYLLNGTDIPISKVDPVVFKQCESTNPIQFTDAKKGDTFVQELLNITNQNNQSGLVGFDLVDVTLFDKLTAKTSLNYQDSFNKINHCLRGTLVMNTNYSLLKEARLAAFTLAEKISCLTSPPLTTIPESITITEQPKDNSLAIGLGVGGGILGLYSLCFCCAAIAYASGIVAGIGGVIEVVENK